MKQPAASKEQYPPSGGATPMEGSEEGRTRCPVEAVAVAMEVDGGVAEPLLGAYADLPFVSFATGGGFACVAGGQAHCNRAKSVSSFAGDWAGGPALPGDYSWWEVSAFGDCFEWGEPVAGTLCGLQGEPQQPASGSLEEVRDVAPRDEEARSAQPQGSPLVSSHQNALSTLDFGKCPYPSCRFEL